MVADAFDGDDFLAAFLGADFLGAAAFFSDAALTEDCRLLAGVFFAAAPGLWLAGFLPVDDFAVALLDAGALVDGDAFLAGAAFLVGLMDAFP